MKFVVTKGRRVSSEGQPSQFIDEIVECTLQAVAEYSVFDDVTLARLRELADASTLTDYEKVVEALSSGEKT